MMKKIKFKLDKADILKIKAYCVINRKSLRSVILEKSQDVIVQATVSSNPDYLKDIVCSKDDRYDVDAELISASIDIDEDLHGLIKKLGKEHGFKIKHFVRGILIEILTDWEEN